MSHGGRSVRGLAGAPPTRRGSAHPAQARRVRPAGGRARGGLDGATHRLAALPAGRIRGDRGGGRAAGGPRLSDRSAARSTVALYLLAASRDQQRPWTRPTTGIAVGLLLAYLGAAAAARGTFPASELFHTGLAWAVAWFAGERTRLRRDGTSRASRARGTPCVPSARPSVSACSPSPRRARIARDLHDSAGHAISVIAVRAGAARLRHRRTPIARWSPWRRSRSWPGRRPRRSTSSSARYATAARPTRSWRGPWTSLDTLVAHHQAAGLEVTLDTTGAARPLGAAADQAAYRIAGGAHQRRPPRSGRRQNRALPSATRRSRSPSPTRWAARGSVRRRTRADRHARARPCWAAPSTPSAPTARSASTPGFPTKYRA